MRGIAVIFVCIASLFVANLSFADEVYNVTSVTVDGNRRIDSEAILKSIKAKRGPVSSEVVDEDIRTLYKTGFFEQITASFGDSGYGGRTLRYTVVEKPTVRKVFIKGNEEISESELADVLNFGDKRFVDKTAISALIRRGISYYQSHGYYDASFTHSVVVVGDNQVDVTFTVDEGDRYKIRNLFQFPQKNRNKFQMCYLRKSRELSP